MNNKEKNLAALNEDNINSNKPLSDQEISSLIKASNQKNFSAVELKVKKENSNNFRKISLHEIAKQAKAQKANNQEPEQKTHQTIQEEPEKNTNLKKDVDDISHDKNDDLKKNEQTEKNTLEEEKQKEIKEKTYKESEHLEILEETKKNEYERGKSDAFNEIKDGSEAAIAELKKITENISKIEKLDLENLENLISDKILELTSDLSGKVIKALPTDFIKKIKKFLTQLENIDGNIDIFINENDMKVIESDKNIKKEIENLRLLSNKDLKHGEIELQVNGIKISQKL